MDILIPFNFSMNARRLPGEENHHKKKIIQFRAHSQMQHAVVFNHREPTNDREGWMSNATDASDRLKLSARRRVTAWYQQISSRSFKRQPFEVLLTKLSVSLSWRCLSLYLLVHSCLSVHRSQSVTGFWAWQIRTNSFWLVEIKSAKPDTTHHSPVLDPVALFFFLPPSHYSFFIFPSSTSLSLSLRGLKYSEFN